MSNEIAKDGNLGVDILEKEIPVKPQVSGACEMLGLDPLYVANEGKFMMVVDAAKTQDVLNALRKDTNGTDATIIGHITKEHIGQVILQSRIGGKRVVNMLPGEQLPRIC